MKKAKIVSITMACIVVMVLCFILLPGSTPQSVQASEGPPLPTVTGPIPVTADSYPFDPSANTNFTSFGYVEEEFFISGTANVYRLVGSGYDVEVMTPNLPYTTRILVRRPTDPSRFSGNVIVDLMNPTMNYDWATGWLLFHRQIMDNGDAWVGITCRRVILTGLKTFDPARYAPLSWATDRAQAWDIFTQVGALLKSSHPSNPLAGFNVKYLYGHGYSQTGGYLITYINFIHPIAKLGGKPIYDGYIPAAIAGPIPINDTDPAFATADPRRVIQPRGVPVIHVQTETDVVGSLVTRRPDSDTPPDLFRRYEVPGSAHSTVWGAFFGPSVEHRLKAGITACPWCCNEPFYTDFPVHYVFDGVLANLDRWVRTGTPPPKANHIEVVGTTIQRDDFGNAKGGLRTPYVDVPIKTYRPSSTAVTPVPPSTDPCFTCRLWCGLLGNMVPFTEARFNELYGDCCGYVSRFIRSADKLFEDGWLTKGDVARMKAEESKCDKTPPVVSITAPAEGYYRTDTLPLLAYTVIDNCDPSPDVVVTGWSTEEGTHTVIVTATDAAGNVGSASRTYAVDNTPPVVTITSPGNEAAYTLNQVVTADWTATDALSGIASAIGTVPSGTPIHTSTVGTKTFTVSATDDAGNTRLVTHTYYVRYAYGGILQPINPDGSSIFKLGSTVPVKFQLRDAGGAFVTNAVARIFVQKISDSVSGTEMEAVSTGAATTGNLFRYCTDGNQYIFNLNTKPLSRGTWQIRIQLDDGTSQLVNISLK